MSSLSSKIYKILSTVFKMTKFYLKPYLALRDKKNFVLSLLIQKLIKILKLIQYCLRLPKLGDKNITLVYIVIKISKVTFLKLVIVDFSLQN